MSEYLISDIDKRKKLSEKKSYLIYLDSVGIFEKLDDHQELLLHRAIIAYQLHGIEPEDHLTSCLFESFKSQFKRDDEAYLKRCRKNKANRNMTSGDQSSRMVTNGTDRDRDRDREREQTITPPPPTTNPTKPTLPNPMIGSISALGGK